MKVFMYILFFLALFYFMNYLMIFLFTGRKARKLRSVNIGHKTQETKTVKTPNWGGVKLRILNLIEGWIRFSLMHLGRIPCHMYRDFILRHIYHVDMGEGAVIYGGFEIRAPWNVHIGKGAVIGDNSILDGRCGLYIGENVNFSTGVNIWTLQHDLNDSMFRCNDKG